jgi:signal transduction histidine kinase
MPPAVCSLAAVTASLFELLSLQAEESGVRIVSDIPPALTALCPEDGIRRVLLNLITNALQASTSGGQITVSGVREGQWAILRVADDGPGISAEMRPLLFEPFRTSKARGIGLGLAVCKKIVEACGGTVIAGEAAGGGALFTVRLTFAEREEEIC